MSASVPSISTRHLGAIRGEARIAGFDSPRHEIYTAMIFASSVQARSTLFSGSLLMRPREVGLLSVGADRFRGLWASAGADLKVVSATSRCNGCEATNSLSTQRAGSPRYPTGLVADWPAAGCGSFFRADGLDVG
jgi:hypothetical protein